MDLQKITSTGTAIAVVGTGTVVGGNVAIDNYTGGPEKRIQAEKTELQLIVREEVRAAIRDAWPTTTGQVKGMQVPTQNYRETIPPTK